MKRDRQDNDGADQEKQQLEATMKRDRQDNDVLGVPLASFCFEKEFARLKPLFEAQGMTVRSLKGFTEERFMAAVERQDGPHMQIPSWLDQRVSETDDRTLRSFLKPDLKKVAVGEEPPTELLPFSMELCLALSDVQIPQEPRGAPKFTAEEGWLKDRAKMVLEYLEMDDEVKRVAPMAMVRCSRGGKTRAARELGRWIKEQHKISVLFVSFNGSTPLEGWEQDDLVGAVCRRIAFAARRPTSPPEADEVAGFAQFLKKRVSEDDVNTWLGNEKCVLIIDELNAATELAKKDLSSTTAVNLGLFLKKSFLIKQGRHLVFTTHVLSTTNEFRDYLDRELSLRPVEVVGLPLIVSLHEARNNLHLPNLEGPDVLLFGSIPALVFTYESFSAQLLSNASFLLGKAEPFRNDGAVKGMLKTFFSGKMDVDFPVALSRFMSGGENGIVRWVPFYLVKIFELFSETIETPGVSGVSDGVRDILKKIASYFVEFGNAKDLSGGKWESLFNIVLFIRCLIGNFHGTLLPLGDAFKNCGVSVDEFAPFPQGFVYSDIKNLADLLKHLNKPPAERRICLYFPKRSNFEMFDSIVIAYPGGGLPGKIYGYQLKEGAQIPSTVADVTVERAFVFRGDPAKNPKELREWYLVSAKENDEFMGESAKMWTPERWKKLNSS